MPKPRSIPPLALLAALALTAGCGRKPDDSKRRARSSRARPAPRPPLQRQLLNLEAFTRLYGYVRYFHPSDEAAALDWNAFAIHGAGRVAAARTQDELAATLRQLFRPIAPSLRILRPGEQALPAGPTATPSKGRLTAWQHQGVWPGKSFLYSSIRLHRANPRLLQRTGHGYVIQILDPSAHRGRKFRLEAHVRTQGVDRGPGGAALWLRISGANASLRFFDNMAGRKIRSKTWRKYTIRGTVSADAVDLRFGAMAHGVDRVWVDGFKLSFADGKRGWVNAPLANPGFETGPEGGPPDRWLYRGTSYEAKVVSAGCHTGKRCLTLTSALPTGSATFTGELFPQAPKPGEAIRKSLAGDLRCHVPLTLPTDDKHTYPRADREALRRLEQQLALLSGAKITAPRRDVRLATIIVAWNVLQHFYPYFDVIKVNWPGELTAALKAALRPQTPHEHLTSLRRLLAKLRDGHAGAFHLRLQANRAGPRFRAAWIEGRVVVVATSDPARLRRGDELISVNGVPAAQALARAEELLSGSPQWKRSRALSQLGFGPRGTKLRLTLRRNGKTAAVQVDRDSSSEVPEFAQGHHRQLGADVHYVDLTQMPWAKLEALIPTLAKARGVVFDLRGYPNGNHLILQHLLRRGNTSQTWMQIPQTLFPDRERRVGWKKLGWALEPRQPRIPGRVVFLADARAISYAESLLAFVRPYKLGEILGEPTAGANGNVNPVQLPGGFSIAFTGMRVVKHDGSQLHTIGVLPTIRAARTLKGVREGRDELLEKAVQWIRSRSRKPQGSGGP
ncbi:MAG: S41 family peptidase [bacterium]